MVYLELLRNGYDVYVGKIDEFEIDFVSQKGKETLYYQVALTVRGENTLKRELRPLTAVKDRYPKFVLTLDDDPEMQYDGIRIMNARDWLPEKTDRYSTAHKICQEKIKFVFCSGVKISHIKLFIITNKKCLM